MRQQEVDERAKWREKKRNTEARKISKANYTVSWKREWCKQLQKNVNHSLRLHILSSHDRLEMPTFDYNLWRNVSRSTNAPISCLYTFENILSWLEAANENILETIFSRFYGCFHCWFSVYFFKSTGHKMRCGSWILLKCIN